jgi:hypothetical protein
MEPARTIIKLLGGEAKVSEITGRAYTAPYRWQHPVEKGGTGGLIPQRLHVRLLDYARANGIPLSPADFLPVHQPSPEAPQPEAAPASVAPS